MTFTDEDLVRLLAAQGQPIAFTGHRLDKVGGFEDVVRKHMLLALAVARPSEVISGMASGIDTWAALTALKLNIPLRCAVPFKGQEKLWPHEACKVYQHILSQAAFVNIVCEGGYHASKMQARNEWMVDRCALLLAYWNGSTGGTKNCLDYARRVERDRLIFIPSELTA